MGKRAQHFSGVDGTPLRPPLPWGDESGPSTASEARVARRALTSRTRGARGPSHVEF